jgi:hypothetical protein
MPPTSASPLALLAAVRFAATGSAALGFAVFDFAVFDFALPDLALAFGAGVVFATALFTSATSTGCSRVMLRAGLSSRRPWKTEWRIRPSGVHSPNETSATSVGRTQ